MKRRRLQALIPAALAASSLLTPACREVREAAPQPARESRPAEEARSSPDASIPELPGLAEASEPVRELLEETRRVVENSPDKAEAWGNYGMALDAHEAFPEAERCYARAAAIDLKAFHWAYLDATMLDFIGAPLEQVSAAYDRAAELNPRFAPLFLRYGLVLMRFGETEGAIAQYRRALELDPDFAWALRSLGQAQLAAGEAAAAVESLQAAAALAPEDGAIDTALESALFQLGRVDEADEVKAGAEGKSPDKSIPDPIRFRVEGLARSSHRLRARIARSLAKGGCRAALDDLLLLERVDPDSASAQAQLGDCLVAVGRTVDGEARLRRALALPEPSETAGVSLGRLLTAQGRHLEAAELYDDMARASAEPSTPLLARAGALVRAGDSQAALGALAQAEAAGASGPAFDHDYGTTLQAVGRWAEAELRFRRVLEVQPDSPNTHYNLGLVLLQRGEKGEAARHFREASRLAPGHPAEAALRSLEEE